MLTAFILFFFNITHIQAQTPELILPIGHSDIISDACYSPDGKNIATTSVDRTVKIWNAESGKLLLTLDGFTDWEIVNTIKFSTDNKALITYSEAGKVQIWDIKYGQMIPDPEGKYSDIHQETNIIIQPPPNDGMAYRIKIESEVPPVLSPGKERILAAAHLTWHSGEWKKLTWTSDTIYADELYGMVVVSYDSENGKMLKVYFDSTTIDQQNGLVGNEEPFYKICFSPDGNNVMTVSDKCRVYDTESGKLLFTIDEYNIDPHGFSYSKDSKRIVGFGDSTFLFDASDGKLLHTYEAPIKRIYNRFEENEQIVYSCCFSPDGKKFFIVTGKSNSLKIYDVNNGNLILNLTGSSMPLSEAVFSPDARYLLSKSFDEIPTAKIWDLYNGKILHGFVGHEWSNAGYDKEGRSIHTFYQSAHGITTVNKWNPASGERLSTVDLKADSVSGFSPDNKALIAIDKGNIAKILDAETGEQIHSLSKSVGLASKAYYSPDGKIIITSSEFNFANIWDAETGKFMRPLRGLDEDGDSIKLQTYTYIEKLDIETGNPVIDSILQIFEKPFIFSSDSKILISGGDNNLLQRIWNIENGSLVNNFYGRRAAINPDGTRVLIFDMAEDEFSEVPKIWDITANKLLFTLEADPFQRITASFSPDGKNILTVSHDSVKIWDAQNGKLKTPVYFQGTFYDIDWKNEKLVVHDNSRLVIYNIRTGEQLCSLIAIDSTDYLALTPDNYYMGTKNAASRLSWRIGGKLYSFDQFDLQYNRPDIVLERLGNTDTTLIEMYRKAYEKRLKKAGFSEKMFSEEWHTPEMKILNSDSVDYSTDKSTVNLKIFGTDSRYNLNRLMVWVNGIPVYGANGINLTDVKTNSVFKTIKIDLAYGTNNIKVSCINEKGVESLRESVDVEYSPAVRVKPDLYVITMSVSTYKDKRYSLQYAAKDGKDIASLFSTLDQPDGGYGKVSVYTLLNKKAVKENFFSLKHQLSRTKVDDQIIIFVSGHGLLNKDLDFYFATYNTDFRHPEINGISFDEIESILDSIPARKKLLMMDACHSGEVDKDQIRDLTAEKETSSGEINFRGNIREYDFRSNGKLFSQSGITLTNSFDLMQELFTGLDNGTGTTVISAAAGKGYALESPLWNNGVFTFSIINGLKNRAADKNRDGAITISELIT
ncbi:MAG: hypothetical protein MUF36_04245 [Bacteroidales bacterium]|nr:hypothetical protein [Bacteroidales bacterium]